ncbi:unnamed protein product, partial [Rotaria sordida]
MATNDDHKETLQIMTEKQLDEQEKLKQEIQQLQDEIEKMKCKAEEIELIEERKYNDEIEKMKNKTQDINQIQATIDQYKFNKRMREFDVLIQIEKTKQQIERAKQRIEQAKQRMIEMKYQKIRESIKRKQRMTEEEDASSTEKRRSVFTTHYNFYDIDAHDNLHSFDINEILKDNNYFNDNIFNYIEHYSNQFSSYPKLNEEEIQKEFDQLIINLLNTLNNSTLLKY